jgi:hypothetical protein
MAPAVLLGAVPLRVIDTHHNVLCYCAFDFNLQEAAKGTRKRVDLSRVLGMQIPPVDVDIPAGVDSGQQIQVGHGSKRFDNVLDSLLSAIARIQQHR